MNLPNNTTVPFFAYGLFKPGQLCFPRIKDLVEKTIDSTVNGILKERDGIPLLITSLGSKFKIKGFLIHFHPGRECDAYQRIVAIEPDEVYRWGEITCNNGIEANVLLGKREGRGSSDLEHCEEWDGQEDPFFKQGLDEIEAILKDKKNHDVGYRSIFRLQMAYTLLWSAIERYAGLKYHLGTRVNEKVYQIAKEKCFTDSLKKRVKVRREVFSATDLRKYQLDPNDPEKSIKYYYQVRSNVVHRGKAVTRDFDTLNSSLKELLAIFRDILDDAFKE